MLAEQLDRACLGSFFAQLLSEYDVGTHGETVECAIEHAISMKIDFVAVGGLQESKLTGRVDGLHGRDRLTFVLFHLPLQAADLILQPPSRMLEGIIDGKRKIGVALVRRRGAPDVDFATIRQRKMNIDLIEAAGPVMTAGPLHHDPASRDAAVAPLQLGHVLLDRIADVRSSLHPLEIDLNGRFPYSSSSESR